ncbi:hypothetical protein [Nocardia brasiliensis]|uniref:hypothetical protein n=1 Tax=Nocardia brasiliensis TaxID=37326 RepID=UPI0018949F4E|nr:hypothetical protein [Nocardia brasiliensis]MBF6542361.1 hypothetical protein [Nocardia brasiliensis]
MELVLVDADVAGHVRAGVSADLDDHRRAALLRDARSLGAVLSSLDEADEVEYFGRVRDMAIEAAAIS